MNIRRLGIRNLVAIAIIAMVLGAIGTDTIAKDYGAPVIPPATGEEPIGTPEPGLITDPTPVWEEAYEPIYELPSTGAGTTAREIKATNHTCCPAAHFQYYYCSGGGYYAYYLFASAYSPHHGHTWSGSWSRWVSTC